MRPREGSYGFFQRSLSRLMEVYEGEYVAVVGARVVAHGRDGKKVYDQARHKYPKARILLGQVPVKEAMVLWLAPSELKDESICRHLNSYRSVEDG